MVSVWDVVVKWERGTVMVADSRLGESGSESHFSDSPEYVRSVLSMLEFYFWSIRRCFGKMWLVLWWRLLTLRFVLCWPGCNKA